MVFNFNLATLANLEEVAQWVLKNAAHKVLVFNGEMGAGKTTLIKEICKQLQVQDAVSSPTYAIVNEYCTVRSERIFHFDFYRLNHESEASDFGVEEYLDSEDWCLLEWAEKITNLMPSQFTEINIALSGQARSYQLKNQTI